MSLTLINGAVASRRTKISKLYPSEKSSKKFYKILCDEKIWHISLQKQFIDLKTSKK